MAFLKGIFNSKKTLAALIAVLAVFVVGINAYFLLIKKQPEDVYPQLWHSTYVYSEDPRYAFTLSDRTGFRDFLLDFNFWNFARWTDEKMRTRRLVIVYTDKVQPLMVEHTTTPERNVASSYSASFDPVARQLTFKIQVDPSVAPSGVANNLDYAARVAQTYFMRFVNDTRVPKMDEATMFSGFFSRPAFFKLTLVNT